MTRCRRSKSDIVGDSGYGLCVVCCMENELGGKFLDISPLNVFPCFDDWRLHLR